VRYLVTRIHTATFYFVIINYGVAVTKKCNPEGGGGGGAKKYGVGKLGNVLNYAFGNIFSYVGSAR
jgi:hypothetical protein